MNRIKLEDERYDIFKRDEWTCQNCGESVHRFSTPQLAHLIANTKANRKRYGNKVIDHILNRASTCSLYCNGKMNIGFSTKQAYELAEKIKSVINVLNL